MIEPLVQASASQLLQRAWRELIKAYGRRKARQSVMLVEIASGLEFPLRLVLVEHHCTRVYGSRHAFEMVYRLVILARLEAGLPIAIQM